LNYFQDDYGLKPLDGDEQDDNDNDDDEDGDDGDDDDDEKASDDLGGSEGYEIVEGHDDEL
jgi:hypothetical protein